MAVYYRTQGFVFKKQDRLEADRVFSVFTSEFGRLEVFGKAIRKITSKLRGGIEIFSLSEIEFIQGKNRKTLTDTIIIEKFGNIIQNPGVLEISYKISEVLDNFIRGEEKDSDIFILLNEIFNKMNNIKLQTSGIQLIYYYFLWNFLSILGYYPEIQKCIICRLKLDPKNLFFSNKEGGVVCKNCFNSNMDLKEINSDTIKILRLILKKDWKVLSKLKMDISSQNLLEKVSDDYYNYLLYSHSFINNLREYI
ncbi:MAG: DNA repair protein RecO [Candidatus Staskawiczbacteria bacterium]|nr:DNA repair protein RecO [Candidatus Staskawiczbacteria bacterium]